jgi:hypothetical protein
MSEQCDGYHPFLRSWGLLSQNRIDTTLVRVYRAAVIELIAFFTFCSVYVEVIFFHFYTLFCSFEKNIIGVNDIPFAYRMNKKPEV